MNKIPHLNLTMRGWTLEAILEKRATTPAPAAPEVKKTFAPPEAKDVDPMAGKKAKHLSGPERRFLQRLKKRFPDQAHEFRLEPVAFNMPGGSRYTPDFVRYEEGGRMVCIEVKGNFRLPSQSRALTAWKEVRAAYPHIRWEWWKENDKHNAFEPQYGTPDDPAFSGYPY